MGGGGQLLLPELPRLRRCLVEKPIGIDRVHAINNNHMYSLYCKLYYCCFNTELSCPNKRRHNRSFYGVYDAGTEWFFASPRPSWSVCNRRAVPRGDPVGTPCLATSTFLTTSRAREMQMSPAKPYTILSSLWSLIG